MGIGYISDIDVSRTPTINISKAISALDGGYIPRNKKCYCYPYNFLEIHNNYGEKTQLHYELFDDAQTNPTNDITFAFYHVVGETPVICYIPCDYLGVQYNYDYLTQYASFPVLPWKYDTFANWSAQNSMSITSGYLTQCASIIKDGLTGAIGGSALGSVTGGAIGGVAVGTSNLLNSLANLYDKSRTPSTIKGATQGNFLMYSAGAGIYYKYVTAKAEYMEMIDDFFTRFGYQVNTTKAITITNRENFDYVQTTDCNITGDIPQEDIEELEAIFDRGVTIWHNENTYGDWNVSNRGWGDIT